MKKYSITILFLYLFIGIVPKSFCNNLAVEFSKKLKIEPGIYELIKGDDEKCQGTDLEVNFEPVDNDVTFRIGEKFIFAYINKLNFSESYGDSCVDKVENKVNKNSISQITKTTCKKNITTTQVQTIESNLKNINYKLQKIDSNEKITTQFECVYKHKRKL